MTLASLSGNIGVALRIASRSFPGRKEEEQRMKGSTKQKNETKSLSQSRLQTNIYSQNKQNNELHKTVKYIYHYSTLEQCRMYFDQSQRCPINEQCDDAQGSCEYCTPELHAEYNFASSLHSIEHLNHEACRQHIYAPPSQKPAGNFLLQITAKRYIFTIANIGKETV